MVLQITRTKAITIVWLHLHPIPSPTLLIKAFTSPERTPPAHGTPARTTLTIHRILKFHDSIDFWVVSAITPPQLTKLERIFTLLPTGATIVVVVLDINTVLGQKEAERVVGVCAVCCAGFALAFAVGADAVLAAIAIARAAILNIGGEFGLRSAVASAGSCACCTFAAAVDAALAEVAFVAATATVWDMLGFRG